MQKDPSKPRDFKVAPDAHTLQVICWGTKNNKPVKIREEHYVLRIIDELWTHKWPFPFDEKVVMDLKANGEAKYEVPKPQLPPGVPGKLPDIWMTFKFRKTKHADMLKLKNV